MSKTLLIGILDRSGSMGYNDAAIEAMSGWNSLVKEQRKVDGELLVSLTIFDNAVEVLYRAVQDSEVRDLTKDVYYPRGATALYDAIGQSVALGSVDEAVKGVEKVVVFVATDGHENASKELNNKGVRALIEKKKKDGWEFVFAGADIKAEAIGSTLGIGAANSLQFTKSAVGTQALYKGLNSKLRSYRGGVTGMSFTKEEKDSVENA